MKRISNILGISAILTFTGTLVLFVGGVNELIVNSLWTISVLFASGWAFFNRAAILSFLVAKKTRRGANLSLVIFLVFGIVVSVNILGKEHHWRKDLTRSSRNSLSPQTLKILRELPQEVKAEYFNVLQDKDRGDTALKSYAYNSNKFKYEFVDTIRRPTFTQSSGVKRNDTVVLSLTSTNKRVIVDSATEEKITNGLIKLLRAKDQTVYFTTGHGERALDSSDALGFSLMKAELEKQGFAVKEVNLVAEGKIPADAASLVVAGPKTGFFPKELDILSAWLKAGGHALFAVELDPAENGLTKGSRQVAELLKAFGLDVQSRMLVDPTSRLANVEPQVLLGFASGKTHAITRDFAQRANAANFLFPLTTYITAAESPAFTLTPLVKTSANAWAESDWESLKRGAVSFQDGQDFKGEMNLAYSLEPKKAETGSEPAKGPRIVVFGTVNFIANTLVDKVGNRDLILNSLAWLSSDEQFISIRPKEDEDSLKSVSENTVMVVLLITIFLAPLAVVVAGVVVWARRSRQ